MKDTVDFVRLAWLLLFLFFIGKIVVDVTGGSYELGTRLFGMVPLSIHLCLVWGAMTRAFKDQGILQAIQVGMLIAFGAQALIFLGTAASFILDASTPFNHPSALERSELRARVFGDDLPVGFGEAMVARAISILINMVLGGVVAAIGWALGRLLPPR